jgi:tellurite resistance protein TehA-like permease
MLIVRRVRESRGATAMASLCVLVGLALHGAWLAAPILGGRTALAAPLAILGMGAFAFALFASASATAQRRLGTGHV